MKAYNKDKLKERRRAMYRIYIYYLSRNRNKDFESLHEAKEYASRILNNGKAVRITIEDMDKCTVEFDEYRR